MSYGHKRKKLKVLNIGFVVVVELYYFTVVFFVLIIFLNMMHIELLGISKLLQFHNKR